MALKIKLERNLLFDGEIRDTLSTHVASDNGADLVWQASYSIQPYHYNKDIGSLHEFGLAAIANQALYQVVQQKIDKHITHKMQIRGLINAVNGYLKEINLPKEHRRKTHGYFNYSDELQTKRGLYLHSPESSRLQDVLL